MKFLRDDIFVAIDFVGEKLPDDACLILPLLKLRVPDKLTNALNSRYLFLNLGGESFLSSILLLVGNLLNGK